MARARREGHSTSLVLRETQTKATARHHHPHGDGSDSKGALTSKHHRRGEAEPRAAAGAQAVPPQKEDRGVPACTQESLSLRTRGAFLTATPAQPADTFKLHVRFSGRLGGARACLRRERVALARGGDRTACSSQRCSSGISVVPESPKPLEATFT